MIKGLVLKSTGSWYRVKDEHGSIINCNVRGKLRIQGLKSTNPVAVGDYVNFEIENLKENTGVIKDVIDRKNYIIRKSTNLSKKCHIIAANIDRAFLIVTIAVPETSLEFIDRFLASAEAYRIPVTIVFNKMDLYVEEHIEYMYSLIDMYEKIPYESIAISALKGTNMEQLKLMMKDKINLIAGNSGVGKSKIINSIQPDLHLKVGDISEYHLMGKHTTTFAEMFELDFGGYIIDTPGIKGFGVIDMDKNELYH
ncbi:MAG: ribosome small subunit-dependent GTPase A, partial [Bacteroidota bacterium]